jgi:LDH2 family malate/lactate/ureidoglycolate dehydrogenase
MNLLGESMKQKEFYIDWQLLKEFTKQVYLKMGLSSDDAEIGADSIVWANLRGVDSHGVLRLQWFVQMADDGQLNPRPNIKVLKETPAILLIDGDRALGAVGATFAMKRAMEKAKEVGIGWALLTNSATPLAIGYYTEMAVKADMIGIGATFSRPNMAPYGAKAPGVHNGPLSIAVPAKNHRPVMLDMATSVVARGKIDFAIDKGTSIPQGWALDGDGKSTTDPNQAVIMLPFGGYKAADMAFMFECLTGIMAGDPLVGPALLNKGNDPRHRQNTIMAAIDIATFTDVESYKTQVDDFITGVKTLPKAEGFDQIYVAGEPEDEIHSNRAQNGIPLLEGTVRNLQNIAQKYGIELPIR